MNDRTFDYEQYAKMPLALRKTMLSLVDRLAPADGSAAYMMVYEHDPDPELREVARQALERNGVKVGETDRPTEGNPGETHYEVAGGAKTIALDGGDGQIRTVAQLADTPNLFILDKNQRGFLNGKSPHPNRTRLYLTLAFMILWSVVLLALLIPLIQAIRRDPAALLFLAMGGLGEAAAILIFVQTFKAQRRFETLGKLLQGQLISANGRWVRHSDTNSQGHRTSSRTFDVTISYTFRTPEGQKLTAGSTRTRGDLKNTPMPEAGTPVAVLYVDDKTFMLM